MVATPFPERAAVCGLLLAESVTVRVPARVPTAVGLNVTLIVQDALAPMLEPHVFVWLKSPLVAIEVIVRDATTLLLVSVIA